MENEPSGEYYDYTKTMKPERPWLLPYHQSLVYLIMNCTRDGQGNLDTIYMNFEETLESVKKIYNLTCGIPQIVYLVGWHHEGHDSKYPDWGETNHHLKRKQDKDGLESLRWLIKEARKYNTTISLHLNMMDAYKDSPLWDEYVEKDIIAKDKNGEVIPGKEWGGMVSYQLSYTQEWKKGCAQRRIDCILEMIPELIEGKTIHIDAFLGARPLEREAPISPYLGYSKETEMETQRKVYRTFRDRGIDVTSEWVNGFRDDRFVGLQAWAWHAGEAIDDLPDELYCTNPMKDARHLGGKYGKIPEKLIEEFCTLLMPWHYKNNPNATEDINNFVDENNVFMPALWCKDKTVIAYSKEGFINKSLNLPKDWTYTKQVKIEELTFDGPLHLKEETIQNESLSLTLQAGQIVKITQLD
jgi:hypothetical protein